MSTKKVATFPKLGGGFPRNEGRRSTEEEASVIDLEVWEKCLCCFSSVEHRHDCTPPPGKRKSVPRAYNWKCVDREGMFSFD